MKAGSPPVADTVIVLFFTLATLVDGSVASLHGVCRVPALSSEDSERRQAPQGVSRRPLLGVRSLVAADWWTPTVSTKAEGGDVPRFCPSDRRHTFVTDGPMTGGPIGGPMNAMKDAMKDA